MESHRNQPRAVVCGSWPRRTLRPDLCRCLARAVYRPEAKRVERPWTSAGMWVVGVIDYCVTTAANMGGISRDVHGLFLGSVGEC